MRLSWDRIERWLSRHAPDILTDLCEGATEVDIRWAEEQIGCQFPEAFKQSHLIHDGSAVCAPLEYWDFYSLTEIVRAWKALKQCVDRGFFAEFDHLCDGQTRGPIRPEWWNLKWVPLTGEPGGDHLCLDLNPAEGGHVGQVIRWYHDDSVRELVAPTYEAWWEHFTGGLEAGAYKVDREGVLVRIGGPEDQEAEANTAADGGA
jgi:cell wall assembly regulator SMI1